MLKNFFISSSLLLSVFFLSITASFSQDIIGSVKNLYMIAELPIPNSDRPYELKVFDKINDDGSFEEIEYSETMGFEGSYTVQLSTGTGGLQTMSATVLMSGVELEFKKNFSLCNNEVNQEFIIYKDYESSSNGFSEECLWKIEDYNQFQVYYAECDDICLDYTYNFDYSRFKSTDPSFLEDYSYKFFENVGGLFGGGTLLSMDFEDEYINF